MSSALVSPNVVKAKALNCPNCGGPLELRGFAHTLNAVCPSCLSVIDTSTPVLSVVQRIQTSQRIEPPIPLGSRGKFENTVYEVIGFQIRDVQGEEGEGWSEYLLFNPYKGFRYLSEYNNHFNFIRVLSSLPVNTSIAGKRTASMLGRSYRHFDRANAVTSYVLGEFPWQVRVGETARVDDFVSPPSPYMLSSETTPNEVVWSLGEYYPPARIWTAFQLPGRAPSASGTFGNQPSPYAGRVGSTWRTWLWLMIGLIAVAFFFAATSTDKDVFRHSYTFTPNSTAEASFVTDTFELSGRPDNVEIIIDTDLSNNWTYFNFALIDQDTGRGYDFGREVSYYFGSDSDGSWTEGNAHNYVKVPGIMPGRYYLRVEPEMDATAVPMHYDLTVRRGVPVWSWMWFAVILLLIPPVFTLIRSISYESKRWRQT